MRRRPRVRDHLGQVAVIEVPAAVRAPDEAVSSAGGLGLDHLTDDPAEAQRSLGPLQERHPTSGVGLMPGCSIPRSSCARATLQ